MGKKNGKLKVEIKGAKEFHGHDGQGFDASIYVNSARTAIVSDDGWGGEYMYHVLDQSKLDAVKEAIKDLTWTSEWDDDVHPMTLDTFVGELVDEALEKKSARGKVVTMKDGQSYIWNFKFSGPIEGLEARLASSKSGEGHKIVNHTLGIRNL